VLHLATFRAQDLDQVITDINTTGYGLTFGLHTRIDDRVQHVSDRIDAGNIYVNRNQIGAIVGSQPFGGLGLSGTGPKAGGPDYLTRMRASTPAPATIAAGWNKSAKLPDCPTSLQRMQGRVALPGPTGESNMLSLHPKSALLCAGPGTAAATAQAKAVRALGGHAIEAKGHFDPTSLTNGPAYGGVIWWGDHKTARRLEQALADRSGPIIALITGQPDRAHVLRERHICVDTTASGGNAALLEATSSSD
jgi:RHH-type proline utilization regulon transcriptional repressor/proline dehydrogenase/delta 1-pyrroline-5-carboxylate dehydrogenase